jgi:hypothetical protein
VPGVGLVLLAALVAGLLQRFLSGRSSSPAVHFNIRYLGRPGEGPLDRKSMWRAVNAVQGHQPLDGGLCLAFAPEPVGSPGVAGVPHRLVVHGAPGELIAATLDTPSGKQPLLRTSNGDALECTFPVPLVGTSSFRLEVFTTYGPLEPWPFDLDGPLSLP